MINFGLIETLKHMDNRNKQVYIKIDGKQCDIDNITDDNKTIVLKAIEIGSNVILQMGS